jgi:hypothetical protein
MTVHILPTARFSTRACMGGWCALREHCPHFHATRRDSPSERLCTPGMDGHSDVVRLQLTQKPRLASEAGSAS